MSSASTEDGGVLYEARYESATADADAFDTWLRDRIADVLQCPGFQSAEILADTSPATAGPVSRTVQYRLRDRAAWESFLATGQSAQLEALGAFGPVTTVQRRVLEAREQFQHGAVSTANCLNCGEVLRGQHCLHCGQRARVRVLSLWALLRDVLGDVLDWDARIWRTLRPLAFRPGLLTQEFLRGRRTHYTPPFRMYLILSVAFFLAASLGENVEVRLGEGGMGLRLEDSEPSAVATPAVPVPAPPQAPAPAASPLAAELAPLQNAAQDPCTPDSLQIGLGPLQEYEPRLRDACHRIVADSQGFGRALYANVPRMMFVFLPLVALLMQLLYAGSGRFYVEHLLFFVHYHAYFFLGGLVIVLLALAEAALADTRAAAPLAATINTVAAAFTLWSPVYLYLAMRRVYGQGRLITFAKYTLLGLGYLVGMVLTGVALMLYTALSL